MNPLQFRRVSLRRDARIARRALYALLPLSILFSGAACGRRLAQPPSQTAIDQYFGVLAEKSQDRPSQDLDVYIDASASMKGFVRKPLSRYASVVRQIMEHGTSSAQYSVTRFRFPGAQRAEVDRIDSSHVSDLLSESFYNGGDTPLSRVLDRIAESGHRTALVISDFVESDRLVDESALQDSFRDLAIKRREMRLLAYRANFDGYYYPESRQGGGAFRILAREDLPNTGRPFYVLVVAPDRPSLESVQSYVLDGTGFQFAFSPTESAIGSAKTTLAETKAQAGWSWFANPTEQLLSSGAPRDYGSLRESKYGNGNRALRMQIAGDVRAPFLHVEKIRAVIRRGVYQHGRLDGKPAETEVPLTVVAGGKPADGHIQLALSFSFPRPAVGSWEVYEAKVFPGGASLGPPPWVRGWSTDADELEPNKNKTFKLASLVETMIHAVTERTTIFEGYLALSRR